MKISVIIPVLNEARALPRLLQALAPLRAAGHEIIVADGGSTDDTSELAQPLADVTLNAPCGRAQQMNAGTARARGELLWFVHADTDPLAGVLEQLQQLRAPCWGRFDVRFDVQFDHRHPLLKIITAGMNWRSRLTGIATGDQAIFVSRDLFTRVGGFPEQPLMEDIELCARLRRIQRPLCLRARVQTSARRFVNNGITKTIITMWWLRLRYWLGADARALAERYKHVR